MPGPLSHSNRKAESFDSNSVISDQLSQHGSITVVDLPAPFSESPNTLDVLDSLLGKKPGNEEKYEIKNLDSKVVLIKTTETNGVEIENGKALMQVTESWYIDKGKGAIVGHYRSETWRSIKTGEHSEVIKKMGPEPLNPNSSNNK